VTRVIYYVGFTASAVALIIALFIFIYFRLVSVEIESDAY